jgi:hypothetical protein
MTKRRMEIGCLCLLALAGVGCGARDREGDSFTTRVGALATANDLTISHIQRLPVLNWVQDSTNPKVEGWPTAGQSVTWRGFIKNFSTSSHTVQFQWFFDGTQVQSGQVTIAANGTGNADLVRAWDFNRHNIQLVIDPANLIAEDEEQNNSLTVVSNAISVGFWVEQSLYNYFLAHQRELTGVHSTCWENWAQRQMSRYNTLWSSAIYPETPNGVLDRVRIDKITIVPDAALPLNGGLPTNNPDASDHSVDLEWGFPSSLVTGSGGNAYADTTTVADSNSFYIELSLPHEMGHARYLIDNYGFNVHSGPTNPGRDDVPIFEAGRNIVNTDYLPMVDGDKVYLDHQTGLMNGDYEFMDRYGATALNLIAGKRAIEGNMNAPGNIGAFMNDLPAANRITLLDDATGTALAGANVKIYRSTTRDVLYSKVFSSTAFATFTADSTGKIQVGRNPFSDSPLNWTHGSTVMLLRIQHNGRVRYQFMDSSDFNLEFWRGHTTQGDYTMRVAFLPGGRANSVLGFESASNWSSTAGSLSTVSSPITEGAAALQVTNIAYAEISSVALTQADVAGLGSVAVDLLLPSQQPNPSWLGVAQIFLSVPSRNVNNAIMGSVQLTGMPLETYNTISFAIPQWVSTALQGATYSDLTVKVVLNVNQGSGRYLLDNFRFLP